jgi:hypothetical protein
LKFFAQPCSYQIGKHKYENDGLVHDHRRKYQSVEGCGGLLKKIVGTVDKRGLKSRYSRKYKKDVQKYFDALSAKPFISEIAEKLRQRMLKHQSKLFLFLDYDGVPWNNNYGEHAVKPFARYRRVITGQINERGLNDYLILLSLYETCEYRGIRFLDFLRSGRKTITDFERTAGNSRYGRRRHLSVEV